MRARARAVRPPGARWAAAQDELALRREALAAGERRALAMGGVYGGEWSDASACVRHPAAPAQHCLHVKIYTGTYRDRLQALWPSRLRCLQQRVSPGVHSDFVGGQMSEGSVALAPEKLGRPLPDDGGRNAFALFAVTARCGGG